MSRQQVLSVVVALALVGAACSGSSESTSTDAAVATDAPLASEAPPATEPPPPPATEAPLVTEVPLVTEATTTTSTTTIPADVITLDPLDTEGVVIATVNSAVLAPLFNSFVDGSDPFFQVHTQQDELFVGVEMYTVFGDGWTGELGTFPADCTTHGLCVYFDPDGVGPLVGGGPGIGTITVTQLDGEAIVTIDDVEIVAEDGTVYAIAGLTLGG